MSDENMVKLKREADYLRDKVENEAREFSDRIFSKVNKEMAENVMNRAMADFKKNPVPWLLFGTGVAALVMKKPETAKTSSGPGITEKARGAVSGLNEKLHARESEFKQKVTAQEERLKDEGRHLLEKGRTLAHEHGDAFIGGGLLAGAVVASVFLGLWGIYRKMEDRYVPPIQTEFPLDEASGI